jgi:hypothetical protein
MKLFNKNHPNKTFCIIVPFNIFIQVRKDTGSGSTVIKILQTPSGAPTGLTKGLATKMTVE